MKEPSPRDSRLALTAGIVAVAMVGGGGFLLGKGSRVDHPPVAAPTLVAATPTPTPSPSEDAARILGRADLIALAAAAADAVARGDATPKPVRDAVGRTFTTTLPFGCEGPASVDSKAAMRWRYDETAGALRLNVASVDWAPAEWWPENAPVGVEAVEGFWIARPWTSSESCPASSPTAASGAEPLTLPGQTLAIGQSFNSDDGRQARRDGKAYTAVIRMAPDAVRGEQGFRLRLSGRIVAGPGGSATICRQPGGAEQRPICMIFAQLADVAIENAATGEVLATWPAGDPRGGN